MIENKNKSSLWFLMILMTPVLAVQLACDHSKEDHGADHEDITENRAGAIQGVKLPTELWEKLESLYIPAVDVGSAGAGEHGGAPAPSGGEHGGGGEEPVGEHSAGAGEHGGLDKTSILDAKTKIEVPKDFFGFRVQLAEKNKDVLTKEKVILQYDKGGGFLDLADYVTDIKGTFYLKWSPSLELDNQKIHVFYLSNAKKFRIGEDPHGVGCGKYLEITSYWNKEMSHEGIKLNTTSGRYVHVLAGTYFFALTLNNKLYLSQLTIKDSRFRERMCQ